ncbi:hypothetical protein FISHEDRAFT_68686, partial [Fistulina hepatica ATCC 64428]
FFVNLIARLEACALELNDDDAGAGGAQLDEDTNVSSTDSSSSSESSSDTDSSTSSSSSDDSDDDLGPASRHLRQLAVLYANRYYNERRDIAKDHTLIHLLLEEWHNNHPDIFRSYLRITPKCFDDLVEAISDDSVFHNASTSTRKVALQFGISYGTWSNAHAKERAKEWVESVSCPAWRDGWCMVDGTLVPLFRRPSFYGNTWFDRKSNYSLNVQLISTPDLCIIDYGVGLPGSQHDATAWKETRLPVEHDHLLELVSI